MRFIEVFGVAAAILTATVAASPVGPPSPSIAVPATESSSAYSYTDENKPVMAIIASLKKDPTGQGITHVADDGVIRTYDSHGNVVDYARLSAAQLNAHINNLPPLLKDQEAHLRDVWANVSGHDVTDMAQILTPPAHLRPLRGPGSVGFVPTTPRHADNAAALFAGRMTDEARAKRSAPGAPLILPPPEPLFVPCYDRKCNADSFCHSWRCGDCVARDMISIEETWGICATNA